MTDRRARQGRAVVSLNDLLVLNAELAALVRAGIPIELGLRRLSTERSGGLARLSERLATRLEQGEPLVDAIRREGAAISPLYAAMLEASLATNRLPEALEGLVEAGRMIQATRRQLALALFYPTVVALVAYGLLVLFAVVALPHVMELYDPLSPLRNWLLEGSLLLREHVWWWGPLVPVAVWFGLHAANRWGRHVTDTEFLAREPGGLSLAAGSWVPGVAGLYQDLDRAHAARMLSLLLRQRLPLPQALSMVAKLTGGRELRRGFERMAERIAAGEGLPEVTRSTPKLPTLLSQLLRAGAADQELPLALQQAGEIYTRRSQRRLEFIRSTLAPLFLLVIGGCSTILLAVSLGVPLRWIVQEMVSQT